MSTETDVAKTSRVAVNDITGDPILTKSSTQKYRDNWDKIFGKDSDVALQQKEVEKRD